MTHTFQVPAFVLRDVVSLVEKLLLRVGLLHRVFGRVKQSHSVALKVEQKSYGRERKLQDLIGVRVALYFADDVSLADELLAREFALVSRTEDVPQDDEFRPRRRNLVFQLPEAMKREVLVSPGAPIDLTFELQLRSVLAEGWHEIEHDLRYKCSSDWTGQADLSRALNGIEATLETADWSMLQLFDELALRQYRAGRWAEMLRHKFRLRLIDIQLAPEIGRRFDLDKEVAKRFFRVPRHTLVRRIAEQGSSIPLTTSNLVYVANHYFVHDDAIREQTPRVVMEMLGQAGTTVEPEPSLDLAPLSDYG